MAESYSVTARISAKDSGFKSTLDKCSSALDKIDSKLNAFSFGFISEIGRSAFNALTSDVTEMVGELSDAGKAWKTFSGNMKIIDKNDKYIADVQKELQDFATQTIYSASDMSQTFSQLEAVGTKDTLKLVKGFGGLAAAAENPTQAMKTLSQQATQMAAKPTVAWQDFKLMLEQSPAGMAAVAKDMGMTTSELVTAIQDGTVATNDFFDAIQRVGTSDAFSKMATEYKSVGDAIGGLKETIANKLGPAFEVVSKRIIGVIEKIIGKVDSIDSQGLADKVSKFLDNAAKYWDACKEAFAGVGEALMDAFKAVGTALTGITGEFGSVKSVDSFKSFMQGVANVIKFVAKVIKDNAKLIATLIRWLPAIAMGIKALKIAKAVAPGIMAFSKGISSLFGKAFGKTAKGLTDVASGTTQAGSASAAASTQMLTSAKSFALMGVAVLSIAAAFALLAQSAIALANAGPAAIITMAGLAAGVLGFMYAMAGLLKSLSTAGPMLTAAGIAMAAMGAAVLLVSVGFALLAQSSIALANAGGPAIAVMFGLIGALAALMVVAALVAPVLAVASAGFIPFGLAILMVGAGAILAAASVMMLCSVLPQLIEYGLQGAVSLIALGGALVVFGAGAAVAGAGALVLGAGLLICAAAMAIIGVSSLAVAASLAIVAAALPVVTMLGGFCGQVFMKLGAALLAFAPGALAAGAAALVLGAGMVLVSAQILIIAAGMLLISTAALIAATALQMVARVMPIICLFGDKGSAALVKLGAALLAFSPGATAAGAAALVLTTGLLGAGAAALLLGAGLLVVGAGMLIIAASASMAMLALQAISKLLPIIGAVGVKSSAAILKIGADLTAFAVQALAAAAAALVLAGNLTAAGLAAVGLAMSMTIIATSSAIAAMSMQIISANLMLFAMVAKRIVTALQMMGAAFVKFGAEALIAGTTAQTVGMNFVAFATSVSAAATAVAALVLGLMSAGSSAVVLGMGLVVTAAALNGIRTTAPMAAAMTLLFGQVMAKVASFATAMTNAFTMLAMGLTTVGSAAFASSAGILAFGVGLAKAATEAKSLVASLFLVFAEMKGIAKNAKETEKSLVSMIKGVSIVSKGLNALGDIAKEAMSAFLRSFVDTEGAIKEVAKKLAQSFVLSMTAGLLIGVKATQLAIDKIVKTLRSGAAKVKMAGAYISRGFAQGMLSCMNVIQSAAAKMAVAADKAVRAKAKIHSPSRVAATLGAYWGSGFAGGILDSIREVKQAAEKLVAIPNIATPDLALAYSGAVSADYEYYRNAEYTIVVPVEIDGREVARTTAPYTEAELNKRQQREERKNGRR